MQQKQQLIEQELNRLLPDTGTQLQNAARYAVLGNGKRLRPLLTLSTAEAFTAPMEHALVPACAIEMIHAYSLIHDDLPCMDNDDFRRGKPTLHRAFDEATAVLTGDYLLTYAFELMATAPGLTAEQKLQISTLLARSSGGAGMIAGQMMDIANEGKEISLKNLKEIHRCKTGALITGAILCGAIVGNASPEQMEKLQVFGDLIGLAFQIVDDVLDVTAGETKHGKASGSDASNDKTTYVTLLGVDQASREAEQLLSHAKEILMENFLNTSSLCSLADLLIYRKQ